MPERSEFRERRGAAAPRSITFVGGGVQAVADFREQSQMAREVSREAAASVVRAVEHGDVQSAHAVAAYVDAGTELLRQPPRRGVDLTPIGLNCLDYVEHAAALGEDGAMRDGGDAGRDEPDSTRAVAGWRAKVAARVEDAATSASLVASWVASSARRMLPGLRESPLERLLREDAAISADTRRADSALEAVQRALVDLPVRAADAHLSDGVRATVQKAGKLWMRYLQDAELAASIGGGAWRAGRAPTWEETAGFAKWMLVTRETTSSDAALMGHTRGVTELYVKALRDHLFATTYPSLAARAAEWTGYWRLVFAKMSSWWTDEGQRAWMDEARAAARAHVLRTLGEAAVAEAEAAAEIAAVQTREGLRAATGKPIARKHASLVDLYLAQDVLLSEQFEVNKALVVDQAMGFGEQPNGARVDTVNP